MMLAWVFHYSFDSQVARAFSLLLCCHNIVSAVNAEEDQVFFLCISHLTTLKSYGLRIERLYFTKKRYIYGRMNTLSVRLLLILDS